MLQVVEWSPHVLCHAEMQWMRKKSKRKKQQEQMQND